MITTLSSNDLAYLSPLLILLGAALIILLIESFAESVSQLISPLLTLGAFIAAIFSTLLLASNMNPLITDWINFDVTGKFFTLLFLGIGSASTLLSWSFFKENPTSRGEYFFLLVSAVFGLILIGVSADFLILFLGIEILSISSYVLCSYMKRWELSHEAALKYFLTGSIASAFLVYGIGLVYGSSGTTSFDNILTSISNKNLFLSGMGLVLLGLAFKAAIVPFHFWAPDVYSGSPTPVTGFMAVGTKAGAFAALIKATMGMNNLIAILAYATIIYATIVAMRQVQLRRFFAYSGIAQAGYMLIPLAAGNLEALKFYLLIYTLATIGCFTVLAFLDNKREGPILSDLYGLYFRSPFLAILMALSLLTLAGIPPTAGFFAKLYIFKAAFDAGYYFLVIVGLIMAIFSAYYYLRMIGVMFSEKPEIETAPTLTWPAAIVGLVSLIGLMIFNIIPFTFLA